MRFFSTIATLLLSFNLPLSAAEAQDIPNVVSFQVVVPEGQTSTRHGQCVDEKYAIVRVISASVVSGSGQISTNIEGNCVVAVATNNTPSNRVCYNIPVVRGLNIKMEQRCNALPLPPTIAFVAFETVYKHRFDRDFLKGKFCANNGSQLEIKSYSASNAPKPTQSEPDKDYNIIY